MEPRFFKRRGPFTLGELAGFLNASALPEEAAGIRIVNVSALSDADDQDLTYLSDQYRGDLEGVRAAACLVTERRAPSLPATTVAVVVADPARAFAEAVLRFYPEAARPQPVWPEAGQAVIHPTARIEPGVVIDAGAIIGADVEVGSGTLIGARAVLGPGVRVGRDCVLGIGVVLQYALLGNRVILHPQAAIGQDGFGYVGGAGGHQKIPQIGRVIIQDDVEIGAGTTIDRGALGDTVIGEGTKIDNQVQIGHNVKIGRHCVLVAKVGISGSCTLGDFVMVGGAAGIADHVHVGSGAKIAAQAGVMRDVPAGVQVVGAPAQEASAFFRSVVALRRLARRGKGGES